jgi:hypothetical protein
LSAWIYEGWDGWLFLTGGSNSIGALYDRHAPLLDQAKLQQWLKLIEERAHRLKAMGIQYVHLNIPEKLTVYDNKLYDPPIVDWRLSPAADLRNVIAQYVDTVTANALVHVGSQVAYKNDSAAAADKKIVIFGDSYASQRPDALTAMLAETVHDVEFIWSSNLDWVYIKRARPDVVIYELAERFMTIVPNDRLSLRWTVARQALKAKWLKLKGGQRPAPA